MGNKPPPTVIPLPKELRQAWRNSIAALQYSQAGFVHMLYTMMNRDNGRYVYWFTNDVPTLGVDDCRIYANPGYYFALTLGQQVFAGCHECLHAALRHPHQLERLHRRNLPVKWDGNELPLDLDTANIAMDYVINALLVEGKVGELKKGWYYNPMIATSKTTWQEAYHRIYQRHQQQKQGSGDGPGVCMPNGEAADGPGERGDQLLPPGTSQGALPGVTPEEDDKLSWDMAMKGAQLAADRADQSFAPCIARLFKQAVEPVVHWTDHVMGILARRGGSGGYDYRRNDRRYQARGIYLPARSGKGVKTVVVGADSSLSIYRAKGLVDRIFSELGGVMDMLKPHEVYVVWCDSKVQRVDRLLSWDDLALSQEKGAAGGGATSFVPVFDWIADQGLDPDALIYLTDLEGKFPKDEPPYPTVWCNIGKRDYAVPFGDIVRVPMQ